MVQERIRGAAETERAQEPTNGVEEAGGFFGRVGQVRLEGECGVAGSVQRQQVPVETADLVERGAPPAPADGPPVL